MRGSPRSIMLTWANIVAGWWTSAAATAIRRQQRAVLNAMKPELKTRKKSRRKQSPPYTRSRTPATRHPLTLHPTVLASNARKCRRLVKPLK